MHGLRLATILALVPLLDLAACSSDESEPASCAEAHQDLLAYVESHRECASDSDCEFVGVSGEVNWPCGCIDFVGSANGDAIRGDAVAGAQSYVDFLQSSQCDAFRSTHGGGTCDAYSEAVCREGSCVVNWDEWACMRDLDVQDELNETASR